MFLGYQRLGEKTKTSTNGEILLAMFDEPFDVIHMGFVTFRLRERGFVMGDQRANSRFGMRSRQDDETERKWTKILMASFTMGHNIDRAADNEPKY